MAIAVRCPKCRKKVALPDGTEGGRFRCPCGAVLRVGGAAARDTPQPRPAPVPTARESPRERPAETEAPDAPEAVPARARRKPRARAGGRRGSLAGLFAGLGVAAVGVMVVGYMVTRGGGGRPASRASARREGADPDAASGRTAEPAARASGASSSTDAAREAEPPRTEGRAAATAVEESATEAAGDGASADADADAAAPEETAAEEAPPPVVDPIPVTTGSFTLPEIPKAVETAPVKWPARRGKEYLSPVDVAADPKGKRLFIALQTANQVAMFDVAGGGEGTLAQVGGPPGGLAVSPDGKLVYVACSSPEGTVEILDARTGAKTGTIRVGHTPVAPVVSPDGRTLYVCNRFDDDVSVVDLAAKRETKRIRAIREPVAAALTPDGRVLFVANHLPVGRADAYVVAASVSVIDTAAGEARAAVPLPNGSADLLGACVSPDGRHAYFTHILARHQVPTTQVERGWINTNALSILDVASQKWLNTVLLDDPDLGAANPWGVACTADGRFVCVTHAGTDELSVIDARALHEKLARSTGYAVMNDLMFMEGVRRRIKLEGLGPRGLATVGPMVYAAQYFSDDLAAVNLEVERGPKMVATVSLGPKPTMTVARRGEWLFHTAMICYQQWQSCVSCHPDARADGLNWDLLNDGLGNPKNARSLLLSHSTPPVMISGVRASAEVAVRAGIKFIQFATSPEEDAAAIDAYLKSLTPVPSPHLENGKLSASAARGKAIFAKAGCGSCHSGPSLTDMRKHDVGTGVSPEEGKDFDTPTLVEVWRTAPYLYDGRAVTMMEVLKEFNKDDDHGSTRKLKDSELKDLAEFVLSQ